MKNIILVITLLLLSGCDKATEKVSSIISNQVSIEHIAAKSEKSNEVLEKECLSNNYNSCFELGILYYYSKSARQDKFKAVELYTKACDVGIADGCTLLGTMYQTGEGVRQDKYKAVELFKNACERGDGGACYFMGIHYEFGDGVRQDQSKAIQLFGKSCELKFELGCQLHTKLKN